MKTSSALVLFAVCCVSGSHGMPQSTSESEPAEVNDNSQLVGGLTSLNSSDKKFFDLATNGMGKLDALKGERCERTVKKVVDAQSQVVAGTRYILKVEVCTPTTCEGKAQTPICETCILDLWEKAWIGFLQVSKLDCPNRDSWSYAYQE